MSDRIALMQAGEIVQIDTPSALYDRPATLYAAEFIGETNMIAGRVVDATPGKAIVDALGAHLRVPVESAPQPGTAVTLTIRPERVQALTETAENNVEGRLAEVDFIGTDLRLVYEMRDGSRVTMRRQNTGGAPPEIGQSARLCLGANDIRHFVN